jgi:hypothetical protein
MTGKILKKSWSSSVGAIYFLTLVFISFGSVFSAQARSNGGGGASGGYASQRSSSGYHSSGGFRSGHAFNGFSNQRNTPIVHSQPRVFSNQSSVPVIHSQPSVTSSGSERSFNSSTNQRNFSVTSPQTVNRNSVNEHAFNGVTPQRNITGTAPNVGNRTESKGMISPGVVNQRVFQGNRAQTGTRDGNRVFDHRGVFDRDRGFRFHHSDHFPRGSVFWSVPFGAEAFLFGGLTYFWWNDIWYCGIGNEYVVVDSPYDTDVVDQAPVVASSPAGDGQQMVITEELLNVRSGPGSDYPVVYVLHAGDIVTVHGYDSDWLYITNSNDENGWIMNQYASPVAKSASG